MTANPLTGIFRKTRLLAKRSSRSFWAAALLILALQQPAGNAAAQGETTLAVVPAGASVLLGGTQTVSLYITGGVNLNAFDVAVSYDPALVDYVSYTFGDYFSNLAQVYLQDKPGYFQLVATQLATPGVTGDGTVFNLVFHGDARGISLITIEKADFAVYSGGPLVHAAVEHGTLRVHDDPAPLPKQTVSGSFSLQGRADTSGIPAALGFGQTHWLGPYAGLTANLPSANLTLADVVEDIYPITSAMPRCLNVTAELNKTMAVFAGHDAIAPLMLRCGNAVWQRQVEGQWLADNVIDVADINLIGLQYTQSGPDLDGDVNFSGRVDIFDLALAAGNYDLTSETAYAGWTP